MSNLNVSDERRMKERRPKFVFGNLNEMEITYCIHQSPCFNPIYLSIIWNRICPDTLSWIFVWYHNTLTSFLNFFVIFCYAIPGTLINTHNHTLTLFLKHIYIFLARNSNDIIILIWEIQSVKDTLCYVVFKQAAGRVQYTLL